MGWSSQLCTAQEPRYVEYVKFKGVVYLQQLINYICRGQEAFFQSFQAYVFTNGNIQKKFW